MGIQKHQGQSPGTIRNEAIQRAMRAGCFFVYIGTPKQHETIGGDKATRRAKRTGQGSGVFGIKGQQNHRECSIPAREERRGWGLVYFWIRKQ